MGGLGIELFRMELHTTLCGQFGENETIEPLKTMRDLLLRSSILFWCFLNVGLS